MVLGILKRKKNVSKRANKSAKQHVSWLSRYSNTFFLTIFIPVGFLGSVYLLLFFVLNTSFGANLLHAQLSNFLRGDYWIDRISTDPILYNLTLHNLRMCEAGKCDPGADIQETVITADKVVAKIPTLELRYLVSDTTLKIGKITAYDADVRLDFSKGELNILKVVLPYFSEPEPPTPPGNFVIWLSDLNTDNAMVHLIFDGFNIDLRGVDVERYDLSAGGGELKMSTPEWKPGNKRPISVKEGNVIFDPATFSFALADIGDASEGLIFSGGSGSAGKLGYAYQQMARHMTNLLREEAQLQDTVGPEPVMRGNFNVPLKNTLIDGFFWRGNRFDIPGMITEVGNGGALRLENAFMNTGPSQEEIDEAAELYAHKPSGKLPQESILWAGSIDLDLDVEDPILTYFFGPVLHGDSRVNLRAAMAGDLARVSGDIALKMQPFETFDVPVNSLDLRANMDGQNIKIQALQADTALGGVLAAGQYAIFDGDFDIDLWAGVKPSDEELDAIEASSTPKRGMMPDNSIMASLASKVVVDEEFVYRLDVGLKPMKMKALASNPALKPFSGVLSSHLKASSKNGTMSISLPDGIDYKLDDAFAGIQDLEIKSDVPGKELIAYKDGVVVSTGGIRIETGTDKIIIRPGMCLNTATVTDLSEIEIDVNAHIEDPTRYTNLIGLENVKASAIDLSAALSTSEDKPSGRFMLTTHKLSYDNWNVNNVGIDLELQNGVLKTHRFEVNTDFARLHGNVSAKVTTPQLSNPQTIPFDVSATLEYIDFEKIPLEPLHAFDLKGIAKADIKAKGPIDKLEAELRYEMDNIHVLDDDLAHMRFGIKYADNKVSMPLFGIWTDPLKPGERRLPELSINTLTFDTESMAVSFNTILQPISPNRFNIFKNLDIPLEGKVSFDLTGNIDVGKIISGELFEESKKKQTNARVFESTWIEGEVKLADATFGDIDLGNTEFLLSRSKQFMLMKGELADMLDVRGFVRTSPKLSASVSINFPELDVLALLDRLNIDVSDIKQRLLLTKIETSGSVGFCMKSLDDMSVSLILDKFDADVWSNNVHLTQAAIARVDILKQMVNLYTLELGFRDSTLKLSGSADAAGNVDIDVNGEIDASIARSFPDYITDASGLIGISLSARGHYKDKAGDFSMKNLGLSGYIGVRDPIFIKTKYTDANIELAQGFFVMDDKNPNCKKNETCLYTPEGQEFRLGTREQWLNLKLFLNEKGNFDVGLDGTIDVGIAGAFVKDITEAKGKIGIMAAANGNLKDILNEDYKKLNIDGGIEVTEDISVDMMSLSEPVEVNKGGTISIEDAEHCPSGMDCVVIPKNKAFAGNLMGGTFLIFGELTRENVINPRGASLNITANNLNFRMKDELSLSLSPDIQITAEDLSNFDTVKISGNVDVAEARYYKNFDDGSSNLIKDAILSYVVDSRKRVDAYSPSFLRKMPQLSKINLDVNVSAESSIDVDVRIAGAIVDLELGAQLRIGGTIKEILPTGIVSITEGSLAFKENAFEFQPGAQIAFNNSMDGKIDMVATAEINTQSSAFSSVLGSTDLDRRKRISTSDASSGTLYALTLNVAGSLFSPKWSFESSPYLTDTNIYALILTGRTIEDFSGDDVAMESLLSPFFSSQLDTIINADQFKFLFTEGAAQFVYVKQINKGLRIAAGVSIKGADGNEQAISAEYYFNDNWFFDLTGQNTADEVGRAPTFKLGARLHWHVPID